MKQENFRFSLRSLHLSLRFVVPLILALGLLAVSVVPLVDKLTLRWAVRDMDIRSRLIANTLHEPLTELLQQGNKARINALLLRAIQDERLLALGFCDRTGNLLYRTPTFPESLGCSSTTAQGNGTGPLHKLPQGAVHVATHPMEAEGVLSGSLILVHDMSFVERRSEDTRKYVIVLFALLGIVISVITVFVAHLSWRGWMDGMRAILRGEGILKPFSQPDVASEMQPLVSDLRNLLGNIRKRKNGYEKHGYMPTC